MEHGAAKRHRNRWPFRSSQFWCGLLAGLGVGLVLASALVELEVLSPTRKAWASLVGAVLVGVGGLVGWRGQAVGRDEAETGSADSRAGIPD